MLWTPSGEDRMLVCVSGSAENSAGFANPNIPQCTCPPGPVYQTLLFDFSRVWYWDYRGWPWSWYYKPSPDLVSHNLVSHNQTMRLAQTQSTWKDTISVVVLKPCNCRQKTAKWSAFKNELYNFSSKFWSKFYFTRIGDCKRWDPKTGEPRTWGPSCVAYREYKQLNSLLCCIQDY